MGAKGHKQGRRNSNGRFVSKEVAKKNPETTSIEVVPNRGHGDTGRYDKK